MAEPFIAEIRLFSFGFAPKGWALCNGQLLPINQNAALFSLLGTTYGGDGRTNFGLPDLRGRVPIYTGGGFVIGEKGGEEFHTISAQETPTHGHLAMASPRSGVATNPTNNTWGKSDNPNQWTIFAGTADATMAGGSVQSVGGSQAHENRSPFLVLNCCIALVGIFPSQT